MSLFLVCVDTDLSAKVNDDLLTQSGLNKTSEIEESKSHFPHRIRRERLVKKIWFLGRCLSPLVPMVRIRLKSLVRK